MAIPESWNRDRAQVQASFSPSIISAHALISGPGRVKKKWWEEGKGAADRPKRGRSSDMLSPAHRSASEVSSLCNRSIMWEILKRDTSEVVSLSFAELPVFYSHSAFACALWPIAFLRFAFALLYLTGYAVILTPSTDHSKLYGPRTVSQPERFAEIIARHHTSDRASNRVPVAKISELAFR